MAGSAPWDQAAVRVRAEQAVVHVSRTYPAPREEVYAAWTDPDLLCQWFRPEEGSSIGELDVRPGGSYRITMRPGDGEHGHLAIVGRYLEVDPPERLVFTFGYEIPDSLEDLGDLADVDDLETRLANLSRVDSRVTVVFREVDGVTEVSITHEGLPSQGLRAFHIYGWDDVLERLAGIV
jgi:uncharacterized protein YndB with AHSA1/START domain